MTARAPWSILLFSFAFWGCVGLLSPQLSRAQATSQQAPGSAALADALGAPEPGVRSTRTRAHVQPPEPEADWAPRVELGYLHYSLADGHGGGSTHGATFGGYIHVDWFRMGLLGGFGLRDYALGDQDGVWSAQVVAAAQLRPGARWLMYLGPVANFGIVVGQRFSSTQEYGFGGAGAELGVELRVIDRFFVGLSVGYLRVSLAGSGHDVFSLRIRTGL